MNDFLVGTVDRTGKPVTDGAERRKSQNQLSFLTLAEGGSSAVLGNTRGRGASFEE